MVAAERLCGECSLCCTVLRVDELAKLGGTPCDQLRRDHPGCSIHDHRPNICRAYRCLWLKGGLEPEDRPDRLGAVIDRVSVGTTVQLEIRQAESDAFDRSPRLQQIAEAHREIMPVRITDVDDVMNADRPYRVLLAGGEERRVAGDVSTVYRDSRPVETIRLGWLERGVRQLMLWVRRGKLRRIRAR